MGYPWVFTLPLPNFGITWRSRAREEITALCGWPTFGRNSRRKSGGDVHGQLRIGNTLSRYALTLY